VNLSYYNFHCTKNQSSNTKVQNYIPGHTLSENSILEFLFYYHPLIRYYENKTRVHIKYVNLLQINRYEPATCFGRLLWSSSGRCFREGILQRQPIQCTDVKY
jgi:hypothetical protein